MKKDYPKYKIWLEKKGNSSLLCVMNIINVTFQIILDRLTLVLQFIFQIPCRLSKPKETIEKSTIRLF